MKKFTSIILSVVLIFNIFCTLGITVSAEITDGGTITEEYTSPIEEPTGEPDESGMLGEKVWYKFYNNGTLVIGGEGETYNFEWNEEYGAVSPLYNKTDIKKVIIQDYVQVLGINLFLGCSGINSVSIGKGITKIGYGTFSNCSNIYEVYTDSLSHWCNIMFVGSYNGGQVDTNNPLQYGANLYVAGELIKDIVIPDGVKRLYYTFCGAQNIKSVVIPDSVEEITGAFYNCKRLEKVTFPNNLENIGEYSFYHCEKLTDVKLPEHLKNIELGGFSHTGLLSVSIPENVEIIGEGSFYGTKISEITIPDSVETIGECAFCYCHNLSSVTIGLGLKTIRYMAFQHSNNINSIYIKDLKKWCEIDFENWGASPICENYDNTAKFYINGKATTNLRIPDDVKTVNKYAFYHLRFENVYIPKSVESIGQSAFNASQNIYINNPDCLIYWGSETLGGSLYGKAGSTTEEYAEEFDKQITAIDDFDCENNKHLMITVDEKEATCTEDGYIDSQCLICDNASEHKEIQATGHNYYVDEENSPSCYSNGYKSYYCDKCGDSYKEIIEKIPHNYINGYCTMCGERDPSYPTETNKPKTVSDWEVVKPATCSESGVEVNYKTHNSKIIPALGHKTKIVGKKSATYFTKGYTGDKKCTVCGKIISKGKATAKLKLNTPKVKITAGKKKLTVKYTKVKNATGFQVKYTCKGKTKTKTYSTKKSVTKFIKKLKKGTYKVKVRALIKSKGKTAYSNWTKAKKYKVK